jgi:hypothetical protein
MSGKISLEFSAIGWSEIVGCLGCAPVKNARSTGKVSLDQYGTAEIICQCGREYKVAYYVSPRFFGESKVNFANFNTVRFHRMK